MNAQPAALITGASRGLGRALALHLAAQGRPVVLVARDPEPLRDVVEAIEARGGIAHAIVGDVGRAEDARSIAAQASALVPRIELLIHNASTLGPLPMPTLADTQPEALSQVLEVNLVGPFRLTQALLGSLALGQGGTVVHISSDAAVEAYPGWGAYSVSKAALDHLGRLWAVELEDAGVRVVSVDPGEMRTQMHADALPDADPETLTEPATVAARIIAMLGDSKRAPSGARVQASQWEVQP